ncbi:MAG: type IX secretion system protein PorQ, partial [Bacteroidaceae bacterium]|nr:type IX secretion system protein PorQ [Bacteroidaceae bacterium]
MIKRILIYSLLLILALPVMAQEGSFSHTSLRLPMASRVAALGGENISVVDDAPWIGSVNPALYSGVSDNSLGLNFMTYFDSGIWAGAEYSKAFGERHTGAVFAQMMNYGKMTETDQNGMELGDFSPKDIVVGVGYSYALTDRWAGGATLKGLYSRYADFSAFALAVDLGLNYYDEEKGISVSAAMKNIGAPIKTFDDRPERLPFDLQLGFTQKMKHAPVQISLTMT